MSEPLPHAPFESPPPTPLTPELKDLERLVEFELKRFDDKQRAYGWTPWGLMVTLAALAWSFGERTKTPSDWIGIGIWWAALLLAFEFLTGIRNRVPKGTAIPGEHVRYFSTNWILAGSREYIIFDGLVRAGACILVLAFGELPPALAIYWWIPTVAAFFFTLLGIIIAGIDYPLRLDVTESGFARLMNAVSFVFDLTSAVAIGFVIHRLQSIGIDQEALRTAGILVVATKVLGWLAEYSMTAPIQDRLVQLRRAIGLGELFPEAARRMLDETLHGITPAEHMRRHFLALEQSQAQTVAAQAALRASLKALSESLTDSSKAPAVPGVAQLVQSAKVAFKLNRKHAESTQTQAVALVLQAPKVIRDLKPTLTKQKEQQKEIVAVQASLLADWKALQTQVATRVSAGGDQVI